MMILYSDGIIIEKSVFQRKKDIWHIMLMF